MAMTMEQENYVLVAQLDWEISEVDLQKAFGCFGSIKKSKILTDKDNGRSRGMALLTFANPAEAQQAMAEMNGVKLGKRIIVVSKCNPKVNQSHKCFRCGGLGHFKKHCVLEGGRRTIDQSTPRNSNTLYSDFKGKAVMESGSMDDSFEVCRSPYGTVTLISKTRREIIVLDPSKLFAGVRDRQLLTRVFEKRPSTFRFVPTQLSGHFKSLVLTDFSSFLLDLENIYLGSLSEETLERLLTTLGDFQKKGLDVKWIKQRLEAMHEKLKAAQANARVKQLQAKLEDIKAEISQAIEAAYRFGETTQSKINFQSTVAGELLEM